MAARATSEASRSNPGWDPFYVAITYAFSFGHNSQTLSKSLFEFEYGGATLDFFARTGLFIFNEASSQYTVGGKEICREGKPPIDPTLMLNSVLDGFRVDRIPGAQLNTINLARLNQRAPEKNDGEEFNTIIAGRLFRVIRDRGISMARNLTIHQTMAPVSLIEEDLEMESVEYLFRKRKYNNKESKQTFKNTCYFTITHVT